MCSNRYIQIRINDNQYNLLKNKISALGYKTISQFARDRLFMDDLQTIILLKEIKGLVKETAQGKSKNDN